MQPSTAMLAALRSLAAVPVKPNPLSVVEDQALQVPAANAYALGKIDGRAQLARELLEDLARGE